VSTAIDADRAVRGSSPEAFPGWVVWLASSAPLVAGAVGSAASSLSVAVVVVVMCSAVVVSWTDAALRRIPNVMCVSLVVFTLAAVVLLGDASPIQVLIGSSVTALPFGVLHLINPRWVGFGDVKLLAALGGTLGLLSAGAGLAVLWLAGLAVIVTRAWVSEDWRRSVPFGFWLSLCSVPVAVVVAVA